MVAPGGPGNERHSWRQAALDLSLRVGIAALFGWMVTSGALDYSLRANFQVREAQRDTLFRLLQLEKQIVAYREEHGMLPATLAKLPDPERYGPVSRDGLPLDAWKHPIHYRMTGSRFELVSLGADGKPGGTGLACDLVPAQNLPPESVPPLEVYYHHPTSQGMVRMGQLAGVGAFLLTLWMLRGQRFRRAETVGLLLSLGGTLIFALVVAVVLTALHAASVSGH